MTLSKDEAARALGEIAETRNRVATLGYYRQAGPHMIVWGLVWFAGNAVTHFWPEHSGRAWLAGLVLGGLFSAVLGVRQGLQMKRSLPAEQQSARDAWRVGASFVVIIGFFFAASAILGPIGAREGNAFISLFWAFLYMVMGLWAGWRIAAVGVATAGLILYGYFQITEQYWLWMAFTAGGSLILGGLWLRKA